MDADPPRNRQPRQNPPAAEIIASGIVETVESLSHADGHQSVRTEILIEAPIALVWQTLTDFDAMAGWSSSLKNLTGDRRHGGMVQSHFFTMGQVWVADHVFILEDGRHFGWSDPLDGAFAGVRDNHRFALEEIGPGLTRFVQSDDFTGEAAASHGAVLAAVCVESYPVFNRELRAEVLRRAAAGA